MVYLEINNTMPTTTKQERLILERRNLQIQMYELDTEIIHTLTQSQITEEWERWAFMYWGDDFDLHAWALNDSDSTTLSRPWTRTEKVVNVR